MSAVVGAVLLAAFCLAIVWLALFIADRGAGRIERRRTVGQ